MIILDLFIDGNVPEIFVSKEYLLNLRRILNSPDSSLVENVIYEIIRERMGEGVSLKRIMHAVPSLEYDALFQIRMKRNQKNFEI